MQFWVKIRLSFLVRPGGLFWVQFLANSPVQEYNTLSKSLTIAKDWDEFKNFIEYGIIGNGTHALKRYGLGTWEKSLGRWWRGDLVLGNYPYGGYLSDKKWYLNEAVVIFIIGCSIFASCEFSYILDPISSLL